MKAARGTLLVLASALLLSACESENPLPYAGLWEYSSGTVTELCGNDRNTVEVRGQAFIEATDYELTLKFNGCSVVYDSPGVGNVFSTEEHFFCESMGIDIDHSELSLQGDHIDQREQGHFFDGIRCTYDLDATLVRVPATGGP